MARIQTEFHRSKRRASLVAIAAALFIFSLASSASASSFTCYTSTRNVHKLITAHGRVWAGTDGGLLVINPDGTIYKKLTTAQGLASNSVQSLSETTEGIIAGTRMGLAVIRMDFSVTRFSEDAIFSSAEDGGCNWYGTENRICRKCGDVNICESLQGRVTALLIPPGSATLYIATNAGLLRRASATEMQKVLLRDDALASIINTLVYWDGRVWAGTADGLLAVSPDGRVESYGAGDGLPDTFITTLLPKEDKLYIGTFSGGGAILSNGKIASAPELPKSIASMTFLNDTLFIGTTQNGIYVLRPGEKPKHLDINEPPENNVTGVTEWKGRVCVGTFNYGAACLEHNRWRTLPAAPGARGNWINHIAGYRNSLFIRTSPGDLYVLDKNRWRQITTKDGIAKNWTSSLFTTSGRLWAGTFGGVFSFDGAHWITTAPKPALKNQVVTDAEYFRGVLWVASAKGGLAHRKGKSGKWELLTPANGFRDTWATTLDVYGGALWAGTFSRGLAKLNRRGAWNWLDISAGLPSNRIFALTHDRNSLWVGTLQGLIRIQDTKRTSYFQKDGLAHDTIQSLAVVSGSLWIGTPSGVCKFNK